MFSDCMSCLWNYYECPDKYTLWQLDHITGDTCSQLWRGKKNPTIVYMSCQNYQDKALNKAYWMATHWEERRQDFLLELRLATCMSTHPKLGVRSSLGMLEPELLRHIVADTWFR